MKKIITLLLGILLLTGCTEKTPEEKIANASNNITISKNGLLEIRLTIENNGEKAVLTKTIQYDNENNIRKTRYTNTSEGNYEELTSYTDTSTENTINYSQINNKWYTIKGDFNSYASPKNINQLLEPASSFTYVTEGKKEKDKTWHQISIEGKKLHSYVWDSFGIEDNRKITKKLPVDILLDETNQIISKLEFDCKELMDNESCKLEITYDKTDISGNLKIENAIKNNKNENYESKDVYYSIFDTINTSKNTVQTINAETLLDTIKLEYTLQLMDINPKYEIEYNFTLNNDEAKNLKMSGKKPIDGIIIIKNGEFIKVENIRYEGSNKVCTYNYQTKEITC